MDNRRGWVVKREELFRATKNRTGSCGERSHLYNNFCVNGCKKIERENKKTNIAQSQNVITRNCGET